MPDSPTSPALLGAPPLLLLLLSPTLSPHPTCRWLHGMATAEFRLRTSTVSLGHPCLGLELPCLGRGKGTPGVRRWLALVKGRVSPSPLKPL